MSLEQQISALQKENAKLKLELLKNSVRVEKEVKWSQTIIDSLPNPLFIKNNKHLFMACNDAFCDLINLTKEEMFGKTDADFFDAKQAAIFYEKDTEVLATGKVNWNEEELTIDGKVNKLLTSKVRIEDANNNFYLLGLITDITDNKNQQIVLQKKNDEIEEQKKNIETLLKEVHHRVKNNFQIISSLLNIQMNQFDNPELRSAFQSSKNRIISMSRVHESLYRSENFSEINFKNYLNSLIDGLKSSYKIYTKVTVDMANVFINTQLAIPLGLIVNEIITNSIKHGGRKNPDFEMYLTMKLEKNRCSIFIGDNGVGLDENATKKDSLGMELITLFAEQITADIQQIEKESGLHYQIDFNIN